MLMAGHNKNLAIFHRPIEDHGQKQMQWVEYRPTGQPEGAIEFHVPGTSNMYIDLKNTKLKVKAKIVQADGTNLPAIRSGDEKPVPTPEAAKVGPLNLFL